MVECNWRFSNDKNVKALPPVIVPSEINFCNPGDPGETSPPKCSGTVAAANDNQCELKYFEGNDG